MAKQRITSLRNAAQQRLTNDLIMEGERIMKRAYESRDFKDRTYNLHDSYGSAVYHNGLLVKDSIRTLSPMATKPKKWYGELMYGHDEVVDYLMRYKPRSSGFQLVVVAQMPYGEILEEGRGNLKRKYKVISGINSEMSQAARDFMGKYGGRRGTKVTVRRIEDAI